MSNLFWQQCLIVLSGELIGLWCTLYLCRVLFLGIKTYRAASTIYGRVNIEQELERAEARAEIDGKQHRVSSAYGRDLDVANMSGFSKPC